MEYEAFLDTIKKSFEHSLGNKYGVILCKVLKNNGVYYDGLGILQGLEHVGAVISLNSYYEQLKEGTLLDEILGLISSAVLESVKGPGIDQDILENFELVKDKIVYKLVNTASNVELLEEVPNIQFLDLSIIFYVDLEENEFGRLSAIIYRKDIEKWGVSVEELYRLASRNTPQLFPANIGEMGEVISQFSKGQSSDKEQEEIFERVRTVSFNVPFFVLTNNVGINGSSAMLYEGLLLDFAKRIEESFFIIPISIHESLLLPLSKKECLHKICEEQLNSVNNYLPLVDWLSYQVYYYNIDDDSITLSSQGLLNRSANLIHSIEKDEFD